MQTQTLIKNKIQETANKMHGITPQTINEMTDKAMEFLAEGKAKDYHHAVYLAFDHEFQGGSV